MSCSFLLYKKVIQISLGWEDPLEQGMAIHSSILTWRSPWTEEPGGPHFVCVLVPKSCPTLCGPMDCSPPGSSVHGIIQARIPEWVVIFFSRGSFQPRDQIQVCSASCVGRHFLYHWATWETPQDAKWTIFHLRSLIQMYLIILSSQWPKNNIVVFLIQKYFSSTYYEYVTSGKLFNLSEPQSPQL